MGYFLSFGLLYLGYCLADWGHYIAKHEPVSLWWLMSGLGARSTNPKYVKPVIAEPAAGAIFGGLGQYAKELADRAAQDAAARAAKAAK